MMKLEFSGLSDLFKDWLTAIPETAVSLRKVKIYRFYGMKTREGKRIADVTITDTSNLKQKRVNVTVPSSWADRLEEVGVFFKSGTDRYVPTDEVNSHIMPDVFHFYARDRNDDMTRSEKELADLQLAEKFRRMNQIIFIARQPCKGYSELVGMKSLNLANGIRSLDIAACLDTGHGMSYYTEYAFGETPPLDFTFECSCPEWHTQDGTPCRLKISDNATGRGSIRMDVTAEINSRNYVIDSFEVSHRTSQSPEKIAEKVELLMEKQLTVKINPDVEIKDIEVNCLAYVPKRSRQKALDYILSMEGPPVEAAHDVVKTGIFNPGRKLHRTHNYDGGRRKYELALGTLLKI